MLLSIQAGLFSDTEPGEATGPEGWREHLTQSTAGPINEERCMLLLTTSHTMFRRGSSWGEQLIRARAAAEVMGVVLEVATHERRQQHAQSSAQGTSTMGDH